MCFEHCCVHYQEAKLYYTASGIVELCRWPSGECSVLSGGGYCQGPVPPPEESYRVSVCVCVSQSLIMCNKKPLRLK